MNVDETDVIFVGSRDDSALLSNWRVTEETESYSMSLNIESI